MPTRFIIPSAPVEGIEPVDGWTLHSYTEWDGDGFSTPSYFARSAAEDVSLDVSRFDFSPSQDRFAFLVEAGFPPRPSPMGGWNDTEIEYAMAAADRFAASCLMASRVFAEARA